jgi:hypothetical protein
MYEELYDLVEEIEAEPSLKVATFESANPDFVPIGPYRIGNRSYRRHADGPDYPASNV